MNSKKFKEQFVITFLATWVANNYERYIDHGMEERLNNPPVEDAEMLSEEAWKEYVMKRKKK